MLSNFDSFDAGPMWQWNDGINENDFKNCIIDSESERFLKITIERNIEDQRFAIYGIVVQYSDKPSEFYVFFQPSLPSDNFFIEAKLDKTRFLKNLEGIFGTGKIVHPSDRKYPGVVHWQTKEIRMNSNFVQQNPALLRAIQQEKSFQMGFSCTYKKGRFIFMGRSTLNLSIYTFLNSAKYTLRFSHSPDSQEQQYDNEKKDFYGRKYNDLYHRHRESPPIPLTVIITTINQRLIMAMPNNSPPDGRWGESDSDTGIQHLDTWNSEIRFNKDRFAQLLMHTVYMCTGLRVEKPSEFWQPESDFLVIEKILYLARNLKIKLSIDQTPETVLNYFTNTRYHSVLMLDEKYNINQLDLKPDTLALKKTDTELLIYWKHHTTIRSHSLPLSDPRIIELHEKLPEANKSSDKKNLVESIINIYPIVLDPGITPLMFVARKFNLYEVQRLLVNGADSSLIDVDGHDALWHAQNSEVRNFFHHTKKLHEAIIKSDCPSINLYASKLETVGDLIEPYFAGASAVAVAAKVKNPKSLTTILYRLRNSGYARQSLTCKTISTQSTPLMIAATNGCIYNMRTLLFLVDDPTSLIELKDEKIKNNLEKAENPLEIISDVRDFISELKEFIISRKDFSEQDSKKLLELKGIISSTEDLLDQKMDWKTNYKIMFELWYKVNELAKQEDSFLSRFKPPMAWKIQLQKIADKSGDQYGFLPQMSKYIKPIIHVKENGISPTQK